MSMTQEKTWSAGAILWALGVLFLPLQLVVALQWPTGYLMALDGTEFSLLPLGLAKRVAFGSLTLWTAAVGVAVLVDSGSPIGSDPVGATPLPIPCEKNPDA